MDEPEARGFQDYLGLLGTTSKKIPTTWEGIARHCQSILRGFVFVVPNILRPRGSCALPKIGAPKKHEQQGGTPANFYLDFLTQRWYPYSGDFLESFWVLLGSFWLPLGSFSSLLEGLGGVRELNGKMDAFGGETSGILGSLLGTILDAFSALFF